MRFTIAGASIGVLPTYSTLDTSRSFQDRTKREDGGRHDARNGERKDDPSERLEATRPVDPRGVLQVWLDPVERAR